MPSGSGVKLIPPYCNIDWTSGPTYHIGGWVGPTHPHVGVGSSSPYCGVVIPSFQRPSAEKMAENGDFGVFFTILGHFGAGSVCSTTIRTRATNSII